MDLRVGRMVVEINGVMPEGFRKMRFRIDNYANRTTYERQVTALLEFVVQKRSRLCDMLVAAGVGKVDLAVLGGDGFMQDKDKLGGGTTSVSIGLDGKMDEDDVHCERIGNSASKPEQDHGKEDKECPGPDKAPDKCEKDVEVKPKTEAELEMESIIQSAQDLLGQDEDGDDEKNTKDANEHLVEVAEEKTEEVPLVLPGETPEQATKRRTN